MQTRIVKTTETEQKIERMMAIAAENSRLIAEQLEFLKRQQMAWYLAYHSLRQLNDVGHEVPLTEERLKGLLDEHIYSDPIMLAAAMSAEGRV